MGIVLNLCVDKNSVALGIVPDVYAKGLDAYSICLNKTDGTEDAKGLTSLAETPFGGASATHPRGFCLHGRMVNEHLQLVLSITQNFGDVKCPDGTAHQFLGILMPVQGNGGISADTLELEEVALAFCLGGCKHLII